MLDYFRIPHYKGSPKILVYKWSFYSNQIKKDTTKMVNYFRNYPMWVASNHILGQFLITLGIKQSLDNWDFYYACREECLYHSVDFGITSSVNSGIIHNGAFYGGDKEILIATTGSYDPDKLAKYWYLLKPVNVLRHQYDHLDYQPIDKKSKGSGKINVILIDLILLSFQYRGFRQYENYLLSKGEIDTLSSMSKFLFKYPLANMLYSHNERVILNAFMGYLLNDKIYKFFDMGNNVNRFVSDFKLQIEESVTNTTKTLLSNGWNAGKCLNAIPTLYHDSIGRYSKFPNMEINRQDSWAMVYSALPVLAYGLLLGGKDYLNVNSSSIYGIDRTLFNFRHDGIWNKAVTQHIKKDIRSEIDYLESLMDIKAKTFAS